MGLATVGVGLNVVDAKPAQASHFRATQLTWHATGTANQVEFHASVSARRSFYGSPNVGSTIQPVTLDYGDGTSDAPAFTVTFVDAANDYVIAEAHVTKTYSGLGPWNALITSCCRLGGPQHINNPDGSFQAATIVNLAATTASPVSSISPIVDCPKNAVCSFQVPATDPDSQALRWRFATSAEADGFSFVQPGPPHATNAATINATTGQYSWNTTGATLSSSGDTFYSTQVMVENLVGGTVVTKTPVDFFIRLSDAANTNQAPQFTSPTPADGTVINATVGSPVSFNTAASDPDAADTVILGMLGRPASATYNTVSGNPATGTFSWTPGAIGSVILTLSAQDNSGLQAVQRSVTINVSAPSTGGGDCNGLTATIVGTSGNDTLTGTAGNDVIIGLAGNDTIKGLGGDDTVCAGAGVYYVELGAVGAHFADGGADNDQVNGGPGNDTLLGSAGFDRLSGFGGVNTLDGGANDDRCFTAAGDTRISCEF